MAIGRNLLWERTLHVPLIPPCEDGAQRIRHIPWRDGESSGVLWPGRRPHGRLARQRSDRIRDVGEHVADAEALRDEVAEASDAESLGRIVAGGDEVDAVLARLRHHVLLRLAGEEGVELEVGCPGERGGGGGGDAAGAGG